ncbi:MAG: HAD-IA family hydrolase, partial [Oscillospiraceae bacterium]|nr:HAD-IA family hydrolase [Oscillospiraceae bacterium]
EHSGLSLFFEAVFNSERIGVQKPDPAFFQACFSQIPGFRPERAVLVGDSLRSDILGANQAGIASC